MIDIPKDKQKEIILPILSKIKGCNLDTFEFSLTLRERFIAFDKIESCLNEPQIRQVEEKEILTALMKAFVFYTTLDVNNISNFVMEAMIEKIKSDFSILTLSEVVFAFEMAFTGKLNAGDITTYNGKTNVAMIHKILTAYMNLKRLLEVFKQKMIQRQNNLSTQIHESREDQVNYWQEKLNELKKTARFYTSPLNLDPHLCLGLRLSGTVQQVPVNDVIEEMAKKRIQERAKSLNGDERKTAKRIIENGFTCDNYQSAIREITELYSVWILLQP